MSDRALSDRVSTDRGLIGAHRARRVLVLMLPRVHVLDFAGAVQVFWEATAFGARYALSYVGASARVTTAQGLQLADLQPLPEVEASDIVVVPGTHSVHLDELVAMLPKAWLRSAAEAGATLCSICSGAFALGFAGLLDGRRCTTHWKVAERLQREFPDADVQSGRLYVRDGDLWTSAGIASGIDLTLSMVEADHGPLLTARVAREIVVYMRRDGSRDQQSVYLDYRTHMNPGVHRVQDWLVAHPQENPSLGELAAVAGMSERNLTRRFRELTGITLKEFAHRLKLDVAAALLHDPSLTVESVASRCGFDDARQLRRLWQRHHGTSPAAWRDRQRSA